MRDAAEPLGALLATYAKRLKISLSYDLVLPVPLSERRARERGFNQSELISRAFSRRSGVPLNIKALKRVRHSQPQSGLHGDEKRRANVAGSFRVEDRAKVRDRNVILLDDVVTSGATMLHAAMALRVAGAENILALAVAKA